MNYVNPVVRGFYPDPSVCAANGKFYLVNSSFQFFPGIPLFESDDLVQWRQIGHCLTRQSQLDLTGERASGGIYAPTIRYHNGRFYVVVTNVNGRGNFFVYTDDIYGEWSEPITVARGGIDPSLFFDGDKVYFISNGVDDFGEEGISCGEIDIVSGKMITNARCISKGCGGRYLEGPHLYKMKDYYYLMVAEGGTEYGHMECILRSKNVYGPYERFSGNPILTNRNLGAYQIQGAGHADIVEGKDGQWWMVHLAFRQISPYAQFHNLGRETFLEPVYWTSDGWFTVGADGTARSSLEVGAGNCKVLPEPTYPSYKWTLDKNRACFMRLPNFSLYDFSQKNKAILIGTKATLSSRDNVTFVGMRQVEFTGIMEVTIEIDSMSSGQKAGITAYMDETNHYDIIASKKDDGCIVYSELIIGGKCFKSESFIFNTKLLTFKIRSTNEYYSLLVKDTAGEFVTLGSGLTKYLSSEVCEGFTGVVLALFVEADCSGKSGKVVFSW